jgi:hypothetical protein
MQNRQHQRNQKPFAAPHLSLKGSVKQRVLLGSLAPAGLVRTGIRRVVVTFDDPQALNRVRMRRRYEFKRVSLGRISASGACKRRKGMPRNCERFITCRVAANGRPLGRGGVSRGHGFSPSTRVGCSRTGPACYEPPRLPRTNDLRAASASRSPRSLDPRRFRQLSANGTLLVRRPQTRANLAARSVPSLQN